MSFKTFDLAHDVASIVTAINEVVSINESLYTTGSGDPNVKFYTNVATGSGAPAGGGYWQTVFDSSPTSSQSTALFDLTFGYSTASLFNTATPTGNLADEKMKVYREMASMLLGSPDNIFSPGSGSWNECMFIMVKRGLMKDEIKKGLVDVYLTGSSGMWHIKDTAAATAFKQTVGGDYAVLYSGTTPGGLVYYNAGIIVIPASGSAAVPWSTITADWSGAISLTGVMLSQSIDHVVDGLRAHMKNIQFYNQTNLYSTVYFCRATNSEFNYSSNPTYVDPTTQRIRVTSGSSVLQTRTYITTIGLYDANDNLLAVGKLNKPITKTPDTEGIFRIRLDY